MRWRLLLVVLLAGCNSGARAGTAVQDAGILAAQDAPQMRDALVVPDAVADRPALLQDARATRDASTPPDAAVDAIAACPADQAISLTGTTPAACMPGQKCAVVGFTEASGAIDATTMLPAGCTPIPGAIDPPVCEYRFGCVRAGQKRPGENCEFGATGEFDDECAPGSACEGGPLDPEVNESYMCVSYCPTVNGDAVCHALDGGRARSHCWRGGFFVGTNLSTCTVPCELGGNECPALAARCKLLIAQAEFMCWGSGLVALGDSCIGMGTLACEGSASCAFDDAANPNSPLHCRADCNDTHPCPGGFTCRLVTGTRESGGTCQPQ